MVYTASAPVNALVRKATSSTEPMAAFAPIAWISAVFFFFTTHYRYLMTGFD